MLWSKDYDIINISSTQNCTYSTVMFCSLTRCSSQTWSVSQTRTSEPANSPLTSTSLWKSWTCGSLPQRAAVSVCRRWEDDSCAFFFSRSSGFNEWGLALVLTDWVLSLPAERAVYNLYAVSNHSGNALGGHYTAYCKNPALGEWYSYNDSRYQLSHLLTYHITSHIALSVEQKAVQS